MTSEFGWRKMAGGSGGGRFRTATPLSVRPQLRRGVAIPSTCPEWLAHFTPDDIAMSSAADFLYTANSGTGWKIYNWPARTLVTSYLWTDLALSHPDTSNPLDAAWGAYVIAVDNGDSLYQWIYATGYYKPCLVRFAPDTSGGVILYAWPDIAYGQIATTWHPHDLDGIYCFVQEFDDGTDPGHTVRDDQVLARFHRSTGVRTDILTPTGAVYLANTHTTYLGFLQYATGVCFATKQASGTYATHIVVYDIDTATDATLDTGGDIRGWASRQAGDVWWVDGSFTLHQAAITVTGGAVSISEVSVTCPDAFTAIDPVFGPFGPVAPVNWFANADRSFVGYSDGSELFDAS